MSGLTVCVVINLNIASPTLPIISADDDCIYTCNYADELYTMYKIHPDKPITYNKVHNDPYTTEGPCTLYPPIISKIFTGIIMPSISSYDGSADDTIFKQLLIKLGITTRYVHDHERLPLKFHTRVGALHPQQYSTPYYRQYFID